MHTLQHTGMPDPANATLKVSLISITCVLVVISVLMFVIGFICGHCFSQRQRKSETIQHQESVSNPTTEHVEDLELKENVAYITLRPK